MQVPLWTHKYVYEDCQRNESIFKVQTPCERSIHGYMNIMLTVNGQQQYCIVLDSGSSVTWVADHDTRVGYVSKSYNKNFWFD